MNENWKFANSGFDGDVNLFGVNIFDYRWELTGKSVKIQDPIYNLIYHFDVYKTKIGSMVYEFAAGEFNNLIWGFYCKN